MTRRLVIVTETYAPETGGGETQARAVAEGLVARGFQVDLLTRRSRPDSPRRETIGGVAVRRLAPSGGGQRKKWLLLLPLAAALLRHVRGAEAVLVFGYRILGIAAVPVARGFRVRCILKADSLGEHSGAFFDRGLAAIGLDRRSWVARVALRIRNRLFARADAFVAISSVVAAELREEGVPPERIHPIPNGVDVARFAPAASGSAEARALLRRKLGLPDPARIVIYTGRLVRYKGLFELVAAWREVASERPDVHLVLVGSGGLDVDACEEELRERVRALGLESRVHFVGAVEDVADLLRAADVFAFPSKHEAFGLAPVEAMAAGLPLVCTRAGGLADVVRDGENGVAIAAGDAAALAQALGRLLDDAPLRRRLGSAARRDAVERFSLDAVLERYVAVVEGRV